MTGVTALEVLRRRGWHKGDYEGSAGEVCAMGAIRVACGLGASTAHRGLVKRIDPLLAACSEVISEQFPERRGETGLFTVWEFNDHPDTTQTDVEMVLEKAQIRLAEAVA